MHLLECMKSLFYFLYFSLVIILFSISLFLFYFGGVTVRSLFSLQKIYIYFSCFVKIIFVIRAVHRAWKIETTRLTQCPGDQVTGFWALRIMGLGWVSGPMILIRWNQLSWIYIYIYIYRFAWLGVAPSLFGIPTLAHIKFIFSSIKIHISLSLSLMWMVYCYGMGLNLCIWIK